jgi:hypothetical protein
MNSYDREPHSDKMGSSAQSFCWCVHRVRAANNQKVGESSIIEAGLLICRVPQTLLHLGSGGAGRQKN